MSIYPALKRVYEEAGFEIAAGLQPKRMGKLEQAQFTWLTRMGRSVTNGLGIALLEVFVMEALVGALKPKTIFIIGNSFGWSTLALALMCPKSKVVAIDNGLDHQTKQGIDLTMRLAKKLKVDVKVVEAESPRDVAKVVKTYLGGKVDFAFIDGLHTNAQIVLDAAALQPLMSKDGAILFHDVLEFGMLAGIAGVEEIYGKRAKVLEATTSGMVVLPLGKNRELEEMCDAFAVKPGAREAVMRMVAWKKRMRRGKILRTVVRSVRKKLGLRVAPKANFHDGEI